MGALTLAQYQARVLLACGNPSSEHPVVAEGMHTTAINNAPNNLIRENPDLFPEHNDNSWTIGPTSNIPAGDSDDSWVKLPSNLVELQRVTISLDAVPSGTPPSGWSRIQEYPVAIIKESTLGLLAKTDASSGYPSMCARKANVLEYSPRTQAGYETYFRLRGIAGEVPLDSGDAKFLMHENFDSIIIQLATAEVLEMMQQYESAAGILSAAERKIAKMRGVVARERALRPARVRAAGWPWSEGGRRR